MARTTDHSERDRRNLIHHAEQAAARADALETGIRGLLAQARTLRETHAQIGGYLRILGLTVGPPDDDARADEGPGESRPHAHDR